MSQPNRNSLPFRWIGSAATVALLIVAANANATTSTDFWLAPPNVSDLNGAPGGEPLYLVVTSGASGADVSVTQPNNGSFTPMTFSLGAYASHRFTLTPFKSALESRFTNTVLNNGLMVHATAPIGAVYEVAHPTNGEDFSLRGDDALGTEFTIPLQRYTPFFNQTYAAPDQAYASFDIVAAQAATTVMIYSPTPLDGHPALTQFSVMLAQGQSYSAAFTGTNYQQPSTHPAGAIVIADKPIAISIKDDSVSNPSGACNDLIGDQIVPTRALGQDYVAVKGLLGGSADESMMLLATQNNTRLYRNGSTVPEATLFVGETYRLDMDYLAASADNAVYVHASAPVYASHITGLGCEMAMSLLPPLDRGGSRAVDIVRSDSQNFSLIVVVPAAGVNAFSFTGAGTATVSASDFRDVPGTAGAWKAARISYSLAQMPVDVPMHLSNAAGLFFAATLRGGSSSEAFYTWRTDFLADVSLGLLLDASPTQLPEPGGVVTYSVKVSNLGNGPAHLAALTDSHLGDLQNRGCLLPQDIAVGAFYQCSFTTTVAGNAGDHLDTTVTAEAQSLGTPLQAQDGAGVTILDVPPTITLSVHSSRDLVGPDGGTVSFDIDVANPSVEAVTLQGLLRDGNSLDGVGSCVVAGTTVAAGAHYTCTASGVVSGAQGSTQTLHFTATASDDETNTANAATDLDVRIDARIFADGFE